MSVVTVDVNCSALATLVEDDLNWSSGTEEKCVFVIFHK